MAGDAASLTNPINPEGLNAPFGARCFITKETQGYVKSIREAVLMHRLALGAL